MSRPPHRHRNGRTPRHGRRRPASHMGRDPHDRFPERRRTPVRDEHPDAGHRGRPGAGPTRRRRGRRGAARRAPQGDRPLRLLLRPPRRGHGVGGDRAQPARRRAHPLHRHLPGPGGPRCARGPHPRGRPRRQDLRDEGRRPARPGDRPRPPRGGAGGAGRRRRPGDRPPGRQAGRRRLRRAGPRHRPGRRAGPGDPARPRGRQPGAPRAHRPRRHGARPRRGPRGRHRRIRDGHAGPGVPRARVRPRRARRGRRRGVERRLAVAAQGPGAARPLPRPTRGQGAADAGRGRRGVRRARGPVRPRARLHAGARPRQAGQDGLQPLRVVLRARPPPPRADALRARRDPGRQAGLRRRAPPPGRRRLTGGDRQRLVLRRGRVRGAQRPDRRRRGVHQQPALRRHARLRGGPVGLRGRVEHGPPRRRPGHGPDGAAPAQRHDHGDRPAHGAGGGRPGARGRAAAQRPRPADAGRRGRRDRGGRRGSLLGARREREHDAASATPSA